LTLPSLVETLTQSEDGSSQVSRYARCSSRPSNAASARSN